MSQREREGKEIYTGGGVGGEGKSGGVEKRKLRAGRKGSVASQKRTRNAASVRGRTNNKCRVM